MSCPAIAIETSAVGWNRTVDGSDELTFVSKPLADDGVVIARFAPPTAGTGTTSPAAAGGVSARVGLGPAAPAVSLVLSPSGDLRLHQRSVQGGASGSLWLGRTTGASWLKLERRGTTISAFRSLDGTQWTSVGRAIIPSTQTVHMGMVAASQNPDAMLTATATSLRVERLSSLPAGWNAVEVGASGPAGASWYQNGAYSIVNSSGAVGDWADRFGFTYLRVTGDAELVARVVTAGRTGASEAGVMARASLDPDAALVFAGIAAPSTRRTKRRVAAGLAATVGPARAVLNGWWLKIERRGSLVMTSESADGATWALVSSDVLALPDTFLLGLAFAAGSGVTSQGVFDQVSVRALVANRPPVARIDAPAAGAILTAGTTVAVSASASDPDDRVSAVEFYVDGTRIGSDTALPYQATWAATAGTRVLTAVAIDSEGARTTSPPVTTTVVGTTGTPVPGSPTPDPVLPPLYIPPVIPPVQIPQVEIPPILSLVDRWRLQFTPSADHYRTVSRYVLQVFKSDLVSLAITLDLGLPAVSNGICTVDLSYPLAVLASGNYVLSLRAKDDGTRLSSSPATVTFVR